MKSSSFLINFLKMFPLSSKALQAGTVLHSQEPRGPLDSFHYPKRSLHEPQSCGGGKKKQSKKTTFFVRQAAAHSSSSFCVHEVCMGCSCAGHQVMFANCEPWLGGSLVFLLPALGRREHRDCKLKLRK